MDILKNFTNPWESSGAFGSQALGTEVLEGNVLGISSEDSVPDIASQSDKYGKGNLIIIIRGFMENKVTGESEKDKFNKEQLENYNKIWDYIIKDNIYDASGWLKNYVQNYGKLYNVVIISHGDGGALALGQQKSWVTGDAVDAYKQDKLDKFSNYYACIKVLDFIGENMSYEGKILFYGCSGGLGGQYGAVSRSLGNFFFEKKISLNMYFNTNKSQMPKEYFGSRVRKYIPFNEGLTFIEKSGFWIFSSETKPKWYAVDTQDIYSEIRTFTIDGDAFLKNETTQFKPYFDLITIKENKE